MNAQTDTPECREALLGKMLYAAVFTVLVPLFLWWLARQIHIPAPSIHAPFAGVVCAAMGLGLTAAGMVNLVVFGKGLPMNAYRLWAGYGASFRAAATARLYPPFVIVAAQERAPSP